MTPLLLLMNTQNSYVDPYIFEKIVFQKRCTTGFSALMEPGVYLGQAFLYTFLEDQ